MTNTSSILGILVSLAIALLVGLAGSQNSIIVSGYPLFIVCGFVGFLLHWLMFIPAIIYQTERYFDLTGSISYLSVVLFGIMNNPEQDIRGILLCSLIIIWAIRLGSFLFSRVIKDGKDNRFTIMKTKFWWFLMTWTMGGLWVFITTAAALAAITSDIKLPVGIIAYTGLTIWVIGFLIEIVADKQKTNFRAKEENKHKFISSGLWKFSRHPNYFGEIILWFGIALIALPVLSNWQLVTLISPIFVYVLLTKVSGINLLEGRANKKWGNDPEYLDYKNSTPVLFPFKN